MFVMSLEMGQNWTILPQERAHAVREGTGLTQEVVSGIKTAVDNS